MLDGTPNPLNPQSAYDSLLTYVRGKLVSFNKNDPVLKNLSEGYSTRMIGQIFFYKIVEDRADAPPWNNLNDDQRAAWLAHQLFRKLPSPGRVYRFWREAEEFFRDLLREFRQLAARSDNPWRVRRLLLVPRDPSGWSDGEVYSGSWRGKPLSLLYLSNLEGFLTISNLAWHLKPEEAKRALQGQMIALQKEDASGKPRDVEISEVKEVSRPHSHLGVYYPTIPLELSPLRLRVLVPLEAASACVDLALSRWQERFARVWDRLPLRTGVVAFPRLVPYQAVVEAARNLEETLEAEEEVWEVREVKQKEGVVALCLRRKDGQEVLRLVPVGLPDGREDVFYPYVAVEDPKVRFPRDFRHPEGQVYRHVADLRPGDRVRVLPARVKTLFMETNAARFDATPPRYLEDWAEMRGVWELLRRVAPSQTSLQRLRSELARLEEDWHPPEGGMEASSQLWQATLRGLLADYLGVQGTSLESLTRAATRETLQWAIDWHLSVVKEGLQRR